MMTLIIFYNLHIIIKYHYKSQNIDGNGVSETCRRYVRKMLSFEKNLTVKNNINTDINNIFKQINENIEKLFYQKLDTIFSQYYGSHKDDVIDINKINKILDSMHSELY